METWETTRTGVHLAGSHFLQRSHNVHACRLERRSETEQYARQKRERGRHAEHAPVQIRLQRGARPAVCQQQSKETDTPDREQYSHDTTER
jgi:hypothetical protein